METPTSVREALRPFDWVTSIDLSDAYFHILMHQTDRKWLRFVWGNRIFQFRALPFGLSLAPWMFTMIVRQFCSLIRGQGIRLRTYLDDWLILNQAQSLCLSHTQIVLQEAAELGFKINDKKSELTPSQNFTYLGMVFNTVDWTVQPTQRRVDKIQGQIRDTADLSMASVRSLTSILGQMESMASLTHLGRLHKRPFQEALNARWEPESQNWETLVSLRDWFADTTKQWLITTWLTQGVPIVHSPPSKLLFTDASLKGWGAHLDDLWSVDTGASHVANEHAGVGSSFSGFDGISSLPQERTCADTLRQHHSGVLPEQAGGISFSSFVSSGMRDFDVVSPPRDHTVSKVSTREAERIGGLVESVHQDRPQGMDYYASCASPPLGSSGEADDRPVRHPVFSPSADLCLPIPRSRSMEDQCSRDILERSTRLCVSSNSPPRKDVEKSRPRKTVTSTDRSKLAKPALVSGSPTAGKQAPVSSRTQKRRSSPNSIRHPSRKPTVACPSRLATVRESLRRSGASAATLDLIQGSHRGSTSSVYTSHWLAWTKWCQINGVNATSPRSMQVANHLSWLADQGLSPASLKVRRSAISVTLKQLGHSISLGGVISSVIKGASLRFAKTKSSVPAWDLPLVLEYLRSQAFEPLHTAAQSYGHTRQRGC
ncbi:hypothetical protein V1264_021816 [Littorina saxatilis]|uniref:Reverse transcriptase domain-containing protein n=1 Tax=Littorina saxatilis TaxID=31220 RepID=A0AAN9FWS7_9CAEN